MLTKKTDFLWNMVSADIVGFRNIELDTVFIALAEKIREKTGRDDGSFTIYYALRQTYTANLRFDWAEGTPDEYRALERWWDMVTRGDDPADCYAFYIRNVSNVVTNQYADALDRAHTVWKPAHESILEEGETNPNSSSDGQRTKKKSVASHEN